MAQALVIQHEPNGPAGHVGDRLVERGYGLHVIEVLDGTTPVSHVPLPDPTGFDLVVSLGSVHSVYDHGTIGSWIHREIDLIAAAHTAGVPVLGVCFGSQALAAALGGAVEAAPRPEIGWLEIEPIGTGHPISPGPWLSWHLDRVVLPDGAAELARTDVATQAWRIGRSFAVQFHPEVSPGLVAQWIDDAGPAYFPAKGVDPDSLLDGARTHGERARTECHRIVDWFCDEVAPS
jgi:GMP synthase-like glutamine amidotransferase